MNISNISYEGCVNMFGASINLAIKDYRDHVAGKYANLKDNSARNSKRLIGEDAKRFLFNKNRLERQLDMYGLDIDIEWIRKKAQGDMKLAKSRQKSTI